MLFKCFVGRSKAVEQHVYVQNIHESLSSASLLRLPTPHFQQKLAFTTKQIQTVDNE